MKKVIQSLVVVLTGLALVVGCAEKGGHKKAQKVEEGEPYYAVALINGSFFFGHLVKEDANSLFMNDVYYIQRTPPMQEKGRKPEPGFLLVPQLADFHGPKDSFIVNRDNVLYYQELREDSRIIQTINRQKQAQESPQENLEPPLPPPQPPAIH